MKPFSRGGNVKAPIVSFIAVMLAISCSFVFIGGLFGGRPDPIQAQGTYNFSPREDEPVTFSNVADDANFDGVNGNYFAWGDYNDDGYEDLLINGRNLWRNNGPPGWNFTQVTNDVGLLGGTSCAAWADWNDDGYLDLFSVGTTVDRLYINDGPPDYNFTDVTSQAGDLDDGHPTGACGWGDYDRDGDLDLFMVGSEDWNDGNPIYFPDYLWKNNGDGTFTDVTTTAGVMDPAPYKYGRGVAWGDYDYDGWLDVYISNYRIKENYLWHNNGDGTFTDTAFETNTTGVPHQHDPFGPTIYYGHTIGSAWGDYNNDGQLDLFTANLAHKDDEGGYSRGYICDDSRLYLNQGPGKWAFDEMRDESGIPIIPIGTVQSGYFKDELFAGAAWADYDNDGDLDLWIPQVYDLEHGNSFMYRNDGDGTFTDVTDSLGVKVWNTYGGAWCDYDNDGDQDLVTGGKSPWTGIGSGSNNVHLFQNSGNSNHWLHVKVTGTDSNSKGIGARVILRYGESIQVREVEAATSSHSQMHSLNVEFGLGPSVTTIEGVEVIFSNGHVVHHTNVATDQVLIVTEDSGSPTITTLSIPGTDFNEGDVIQFTYSATQGNLPISSYEWDFDGDGFYDLSTSTPSQVSHAYNDNGLFHTRLRVSDGSGKGSTGTVTVRIHNVAPVASAGGNRIVYEESMVIFNASGTIDSPGDLATMLCYWDMGDGTVYGWGQNITIEHTYPFEGIFTVELMVRDDDGEQSGDIISVNVINRPPICTIDSAPSMVAEDTPATFTCSGEDTPSDVADLRFKWDFGDGVTTQWGFVNFTSHSYATSGTFDVILSVKDDLNTSTANHSITVYNIPPVIISASLVDRSVWEDQLLQITCDFHDTPSDISNLDFLWDFGDGTDSGWLDTPETLHTFNRSGEFKMNLTVRDDDLDTDLGTITVTVRNVVPGCTIEDDRIEGEEGEEMEFKDGIGTDTVSDEDTLLFKWDFGDGYESQWSDDSDAYHIYNTSGDHIATFYVKDDDGDVNQTTMEVEIENVAPTAKIEASKVEPSEDEIVVLSGKSSTDTPNDRPTLVYTWSISDGTILSGEEVRHTFRTSGPQRVTLTVTDDDTDSNKATLQLSVANVPPTAKFQASSTETYVGTVLTFNAYESTDTPSDRANLSYNWAFGDGLSGEGMITTHSFTRPDSYQVVLTVTDDDGEKSLHTMTVSVTDGPEVSAGDENGGVSRTIAISIAATIIALTLVLLLLMNLGYLSFLNLPSGLRPQDGQNGQKPSRSHGPGWSADTSLYHRTEGIPPPYAPPRTDQPISYIPSQGSQLEGSPIDDSTTLTGGTELQLPPHSREPSSVPLDDISQGEIDSSKEDGLGVDQQNDSRSSHEEKDEKDRENESVLEVESEGN